MGESFDHLVSLFISDSQGVRDSRKTSYCNRLLQRNRGKGSRAKDFWRNINSSTCHKQNCQPIRPHTMLSRLLHPTRHSQWFNQITWPRQLNSTTTSLVRSNGLPHEIVAVGSRCVDRSAKFANLHGLQRSHGSYAELCADDVDIVYIATLHT